MTLFDAPATRRRVTVKAAADTCPHCGAATISGLEDVLGLPEHLDPEPVTPVAELLAIISGRRTYALPTGELVKRDACRITFADADTEPVYVQHSCAAGTYPRNPRHPPPPRPTAETDTPPF